MSCDVAARRRRDAVRELERPRQAHQARPVQPPGPGRPGRAGHEDHRQPGRGRGGVHGGARRRDPRVLLGRQYHSYGRQGDLVPGPGRDRRPGRRARRRARPWWRSPRCSRPTTEPRTRKPPMASIARETPEPHDGVQRRGTPPSERRRADGVAPERHDTPTAPGVAAPASRRPGRARAQAGNRRGRARPRAASRPRRRIERAAAGSRITVRRSTSGRCSRSRCASTCARLAVCIVVASSCCGSIARRLGVIENVEEFIGDLLSAEGLHVPLGADARGATLVGLVIVVLLVVITVIAAAFYNLFAELFGGVEVRSSKTRTTPPALARRSTHGSGTLARSPGL